MDDSLDDRLQPLRAQIDALDAQLVELLNARARLAQQVGRAKHDAGAPVFRPEREAEVPRKVAASTAGPLGEAALGNVFREVMSACRALERPLTVAFLGPDRPPQGHSAGRGGGGLFQSPQPSGLQGVAAPPA